MMKIKMTIVYKVLTILMWTAISAGLMVLLVSAVRKERTMVCKAVQVEFTDSQPFRMLDEMEIIELNEAFAAQSLAVIKDLKKSKSNKGNPKERVQLITSIQTFGNNERFGPFLKAKGMRYSDEYLRKLSIAGIQRTKKDVE